MGGLGKSSLAARLADRLPEYQTLVWVGAVDEFALVNRLVEEAPLSQAQREILLNPHEELRFKLMLRTSDRHFRIDWLLLEE